MKFIYTGKTENFVLGEPYSFKTPLNNGDVFDLDGNDCSLMKRCIDIALANGATKKTVEFQLQSYFLANQEEEQLESISIPKDPTQVFDNKSEIVDSDQGYQSLKKEDLINLCTERGISVPPDATKKVLIQLLK